MRHRTFILLGFCLVFAASLAAQTVNLIASNTHRGVAGEGSLFTGKLCMVPTNNSGTVIPFQYGGGGQGTTNEACYAITVGVLQSGVTVVDTHLSNPQNLCLYTRLVDLTQPLSKQTVGVFPCLQPASSGQESWCSASGGVITCNLDNYQLTAPQIPLAAPVTITTDTVARSQAASAQATANTALPANGVTTSAGGNLQASTVAAVTTVTNINGTLNASTCVSSNPPSWCAGSDMGAWMNAAYATLPSTGGEIDYQCNTSGSSISYLTPIVFATVGKPVLLRGLGTSSLGNGCTLNYTPTTATVAVRMDFTPTPNGSYFEPACGMENVTLTNNSCTTNGGCSSSAVGLESGPTNGGAEACHFSNSKIAGFGTGFKPDAASGVDWGIDFHNIVLAYNTLGIDFTQIYENFHWFGGSCIVNGTCFNSAAGNTDFRLFGVSIDSNAVAGLTGVGRMECFGCHFENLGSATTNYINWTSGSVLLDGGQVLNDSASGTVSSLFSISNTVGKMQGTEVYSNQTVTNLWATSGVSAVTGDYYTASSANIPSACSVSADCFLIQQINGGAPVQPFTMTAAANTFSGANTFSAANTFNGSNSFNASNGFFAIQNFYAGELLRDPGTTQVGGIGRAENSSSVNTWAWGQRDASGVEESNFCFSSYLSSWTTPFCMVPGAGVIVNGYAQIGGGLPTTSSGVTCSMGAGTTCTATVPSGTVHCSATAQGTTPLYGACSVSGTTATVTASSANSATWLVTGTQ